MILKKVELPMVPFQSCQDSLRRTKLGRYFNLHESFVCAGECVNNYYEITRD